MTQAGAGGLRVGLARHAGTESPSSGASPGTALLFTTLERALSRRCRVVPLPPYYYGAPASVAVRIAARWLTQCDVVVLSLPPHPSDLDAILLVRERGTRRVPVVYLPLGELPRGAWTYRHVQPHLGPGDALLLSCTADRDVLDVLVERSGAAVHVAPFGIDHRPWARARTTRGTTRADLGLDEHDVVIVAHGRTGSLKNLHGAVDAARGACHAGRRVHVWLVGALPDGPAAPAPHPLGTLPPGPWRDLLLQARGGDDVAVSCWGELAPGTLATVLAAADIAVCLTVNPDENFGFAVVEAMAAGLPVIGTDWGGLRDTVRHGSTGYLVPTTRAGGRTSVDWWAARGRVGDLAADERLRRRLGTAGAARVREHLRLGRFADQVLALAAGAAAEPPDAPDVRRGGGHAWTRRGADLVERHVVRLADGRSVSASVPPDDPLDDLLLPYASGGPRRIDDDTPLALASPLLRHEDHRLVSDDPLAPPVADLDEDEDEVVAALVPGPATWARLAERSGRRAAELREPVARLVGRGLVIGSSRT